MYRLMVKRHQETKRFSHYQKLTFRIDDYDDVMRYVRYCLETCWEVRLEAKGGFYDWHETRTFRNPDNAGVH